MSRRTDQKPRTQSLFPNSDSPETAVSLQSLLTFRSCPLRYHFQYRENLPRNTIRASTVFARGVEQGISAHFRALLEGRSRLVVPELMAVYQAAWNAHAEQSIEFTSENRSAFDLIASEMFAKFLQSEFAEPPGELVGVNEVVQGTVSAKLPALSTTVNLVAEVGSELVIQDWMATRANLNEYQLSLAAERLAVIAQLLDGRSNQRVTRAELIVIARTREIRLEHHIFVIDPAAKSRAVRIAENLWRAVQSEAVFPILSPLNCAGCPFQAPCRAWTRNEPTIH